MDALGYERAGQPRRVPGRPTRVARVGPIRPKHQVRFENGDLVIPDAPGLGVELNLEALKKYPYDPANYLPLFEEGWENRGGRRPPSE